MPYWMYYSGFKKNQTHEHICFFLSNQKLYIRLRAMQQRGNWSQGCFPWVSIQTFICLCSMLQQVFPKFSIRTIRTGLFIHLWPWFTRCLIYTPIVTIRYPHTLSNVQWGHLPCYNKDDHDTTINQSYIIGTIKLLHTMHKKIWEYCILLIDMPKYFK
jgi:hypothetical protein